MGGLEVKVTADIPPARRIGRMHIVPGRGKAQFSNGQEVEVVNLSCDHRGRVDEQRLVRHGAGGRWELVTS
jgi:hypothetical protein